MHQRTGGARTDGAGDAGAAQGGGQAEGSAGERLADAHDVGADAGVVGGEQLTGATEAGGDLVEDQQYPVPVADLPQVDQVARVVEAHPSGALHDGFDDHGGHLGGVLRQLRLERRGVAGVVVAGHRRGEHLLGQHRMCPGCPQLVHAAVGVADAHRGERVAVVAAAPGHQPVTGGLAAAAPVLQRHLDRDLDRHRAGVAEEHRVQPGRCGLDEQLRQPGGGLVGQAAEHDVAHGAQLRGQRRVQGRVTVAVDRRPPGTHRVQHPDRRAVVDERQPRTPRADGDHRGDGPPSSRSADRAVGMPQMSGVERADLVGCQCGHGDRR